MEEVWNLASPCTGEPNDDTDCHGLRHEQIIHVYCVKSLTFWVWFVIVASIKTTNTLPYFLSF